MRLRHLSQNRLVETVKQLEQTVLERKTSVQRVGTYNLRSVTTAYDGYILTGSNITRPGQASSTYIKTLKVTAVAQQQDYFYGRLVVQMYVGSTSNWYRPSSYLQAIATGGTYYYLDHGEYIRTLANIGKGEWYVTVMTNSNTTPVWLACQVVGNDDVTISVEDITP